MCSIEEDRITRLLVKQEGGIGKFLKKYMNRDSINTDLPVRKCLIIQAAEFALCFNFFFGTIGILAIVNKPPIEIGRPSIMIQANLNARLSAHHTADRTAGA